MACHQRSASLPSIPHSTESKVEVELQGLQTRISSPSATIDTMCGGLRSLGDIYSSIEEIMSLPSNRVPLQRKMIEEELDRSLVLVDLCNAMQESLAELKVSIQDLQLALKRGDGAAVQIKTESFVRLAKKAQKPFKKITSGKATAQGCGTRFQKKRVVCEAAQLQALERGVADLENGVESLFRRFMKQDSNSPRGVEFMLI
ncbi:unnamed protein product [Triticum turgidum subsp. durum]|uniref:Uncharacterized protein n=1 Tax=Triticum turgidum subsp. durum TaxID=4567 RepID=A0A9R0SY34_TRITD|nr:unnamed protein product [Triticum turgidum subsp. durum]